MINEKRQEYEKLRSKINIKNLTCIYCGAKAEHIHHLIPLSRGGDNRSSNLIPLCKKCHGLIHNVDYVTISALQRAGIEKAKKEGKYTGRKKIKINLLEYKEIKDWYEKREINKTEFSALLGISRPTLNKILENEEKYLRYWGEE